MSKQTKQPPAIEMQPRSDHMERIQLVYAPGGDGLSAELQVRQWGHRLLRMTSPRGGEWAVRHVSTERLTNARGLIEEAFNAVQSAFEEFCGGALSIDHEEEGHHAPSMTPVQSEEAAQAIRDVWEGRTQGPIETHWVGALSPVEMARLALDGMRTVDLSVDTAMHLSMARQSVRLLQAALSEDKAKTVMGAPIAVTKGGAS